MEVLGPDSVRVMRQDVDDRATRLVKHESSDPPFLITQRISDLEALLHGPGVNGVDVIDLDRDPRRSHVVVADDRHLHRGIGWCREGHYPAKVHCHLETK